MGKRKKEVIDFFPTFCTLRNPKQEEVNPDDIRKGEFRDTAVYFTPSQHRAECGMTIRFSCTAKIAIGDIINIRLTGFKGRQASVFALESRPQPDSSQPARAPGVAYNNHFMAYYSGDNPPKGSVAPQTIVLKCRKDVNENEIVTVGVPEAVHIVLPDKVALNSTKLKIDGVIKHADGGRIPKNVIFECTAVRKRPIQDDITELEGIIDECMNGTGEEQSALEKGDIDIIRELTTPECDSILDATRDRRALSTGITWKLETSIFKNFDESCSGLTRILRDAYNKDECRAPMALHYELVRNLKVKLSAIIMLEEALFVMHGAYYPELTRSAIMVLRLYTCETHDIEHILGVFNPPCIHREINSGFRSKNPTLLSKWINFIAILSTTTNDLRVTTSSQLDLVPPLFTGVKELTNDQHAEILNLKKGDWFVTNNIQTCVASIDHLDDETFTSPDNAVLYEIRGACFGVEIGDCSQYPENREWLLPLFASYTVISVTKLHDINGMIHVILNMNTSLGSSTRDQQFPVEERLESATKFFKRAKVASDLSSKRTSLIAKCIFANIRLLERKTHLPEHLLRSLYLSQFTETKQMSLAIISQDEGLCKWMICVHEQIINDGVIKPAVWEALNRKIAIALEYFFLKKTRCLKIFNSADLNFVVDFDAGNINIGGKGPQSIRRVVGRADSYPFKPV